MQDLDYQGLLAVEVFDTGRGLMVNELAPRVHNSGHYSQQALAMDQFQAHLRAVAAGVVPPPRRAQMSEDIDEQVFLK